MDSLSPQQVARVMVCMLTGGAVPRPSEDQEPSTRPAHPKASKPRPIADPSSHISQR